MKSPSRSASRSNATSRRSSAPSLPNRKSVGGDATSSAPPPPPYELLRRTNQLVGRTLTVRRGKHVSLGDSDLLAAGVGLVDARLGRLLPRVWTGLRHGYS